MTETLALSLPAIERLGDDFEFSWPTLPIHVKVTRLHEDHDALIGDHTILNETGALLFSDRFNLLAANTRARAATMLKKRWNGREFLIPWEDVLDQYCAIVRREWWRDTPAEDTALGDIAPVSFLLEPTLKRNGLTVFFGDFAAGKTLVAYSHGIAVAYPEVTVGNLVPHAHGRVMIIDYEMGIPTAKATLRALVSGFGVSLQPDRVYVRHEVHPLQDIVKPLQAEIARLKIQFVIVDSQSQASGTTPHGDAAGPVRELVRAMNRFGTTTLLISQVSKEESRRDGSREPYGSRHLSYLADDTWEMRASTDEGTHRLTTVMHHRKHRGPWHSPMAFAVDFQPGCSRITKTVPPTPHKVTAKLSPQRRQVLKVVRELKDGRGTPSQIAVVLGIENDEQACAALGRLLRMMREDGQLRILVDAGTGGRGHENIYGVVPTDEEVPF